ncbi:MAG: DUF423 domain-containing protein [Sphingobacteriaceae bacterium]
MIPSISVRRIRQIATIFGAIAVVLGAFGAHALKAQLSATALENWKTAVNYQFVHALALLLLANLPTNSFVRLSVCFFALGILCFSGSLYLLSLREILTIQTAFLGPITPIGGLFFILGWVFLFFSASKKN